MISFCSIHVVSSDFYPFPSYDSHDRWNLNHKWFSCFSLHIYEQRLYLQIFNVYNTSFFLFIAIGREVMSSVVPAFFLDVSLFFCFLFYAIVFCVHMLAFGACDVSKASL
jgi:hypothetical protein